VLEDWRDFIRHIELDALVLLSQSLENIAKVRELDAEEFTF
jgi:hypothetical protein